MVETNHQINEIIDIKHRRADVRTDVPTQFWQRLSLVQRLPQKRGVVRMLDQLSMSKRVLDPMPELAAQTDSKEIGPANHFQAN